ncbi:MAG: NAD(P)-binding protein [Enterobacterales bacterium]|nr:NAD(P)-binding protein [Enterobacterales bacterium]
MSQQKTTTGNVTYKEKETLDFLEYPRELADKRSADERSIDFKEIYAKSNEQQLSQQASRCLDCGNPYCEWKCPLHNYIPNWLESVRSGRNIQAAELMYETNPLPEICGRVCPQDRLCEQACTINTGFGAVTIGAIEKNISDQAIAMKWRPSKINSQFSNFKVAIIGAGPAGLACADRLANQGVKAVVYDRYPDIGGLLTFGIPGFKLEKSVMRNRKEFLQDIGVEFKLNTEIGKDVSIQQLRGEYDALFLAMGTYRRIEGNFEGFQAKGFINALDYLIGNVNQNC